MGHKTVASVGFVSVSKLRLYMSLVVQDPSNVAGKLPSQTKRSSLSTCSSWPHAEAPSEHNSTAMQTEYLHYSTPLYTNERIEEERSSAASAGDGSRAQCSGGRSPFHARGRGHGSRRGAPCRRRRPVVLHVRADQVTGGQGRAERKLTGQHRGRDDARQPSRVLTRAGGVGTTHAEHVEHRRLGLENGAAAKSADLDRRHRDRDLEGSAEAADMLAKRQTSRLGQKGD